jgi:alpha-N-arabinofuranosidase
VAYPVHHILGRETCLAPVTWPKNGWPVVNGNGTAPEKMTCPTLPLKPLPPQPTRTEFNAPQLGLEWNFIQPPKKDGLFYAISDGKLRIKGTAAEIGKKETPAFIGRRLQQMNFTATTSMTFDPQNTNEQAGLSLVNNGTHFDLLVKKEGDKRVVFAELQFGSIKYRSEKFVLEPGSVSLRISGKGSEFAFSYAQNGDYTQVENVDSRFLSTETVGWFTGVYVGFYATGKGKECQEYADFDYFEYVENQ